MLLYVPKNPTPNIRPRNADHLEDFKSRFNMERVSAIIFDKISMIKAWMLTYIDARMREATQINKPFGEKAVIMLGEFD